MNASQQPMLVAPPPDETRSGVVGERCNVHCNGIVCESDHSQKVDGLEDNMTSPTHDDDPIQTGENVTGTKFSTSGKDAGQGTERCSTSGEGQARAAQRTEHFSRTNENACQNLADSCYSGETTSENFSKSGQAVDCEPQNSEEHSTDDKDAMDCTTSETKSDETRDRTNSTNENLADIMDAQRQPLFLETDASIPEVPPSPKLQPTYRSAVSLNNSLASSPSRIKVRNLNHIQTFASEEVLTRSRCGSRSSLRGRLDGQQYEISSMPVTDIIEMVAGLLTKIITTNDRQHEQLNQETTLCNSPATTNILAFHGKNVPAITVASYLARIHKYCPTTYEVFISLLVYFDRMTENVKTKVEEADGSHGRSSVQGERH